MQMSFYRKNYDCFQKYLWYERRSFRSVPIKPPSDGLIRNKTGAGNARTFEKCVGTDKRTTKPETKNRAFIVRRTGY